MVYTAPIVPRKWFQGQVYRRSDLPLSPTSYQPTPSRLINPHLALREPSVPDPLWFQGDDVMHMSLKALREIFRNFDPSELPPDFAECLAGNVAAIKAHNTAGTPWERQMSPKETIVMGTGTSHTAQGAVPEAATLTQDVTPDLSRHSATLDPDQLAHLTVSSHSPKIDASRPSSHGLLATADAIPSPTEATVHRTEPRTSRGKRTQADLALQVCTPHSFINLGESEHPWEPRDLLPEISTPPNHHISPFEPRKAERVLRILPQRKLFYQGPAVLVVG